MVAAVGCGVEARVGTLAVGGVTGWVAVSQEWLGLCVIWLRTVLASLRCLPHSPAHICTMGCWLQGRCTKPTRQKSGDRTSDHRLPLPQRAGRPPACPLPLRTSLPIAE